MKLSVWIAVVIGSWVVQIAAQDSAGRPLMDIILSENYGLPRHHEYIKIPVQIELPPESDHAVNIIARDDRNGQSIPCQVLTSGFYPGDGLQALMVVFPVSMRAGETRRLRLMLLENSFPVKIESQLSLRGEGTEQVVENQYYRADLTRSEQSEAKSHFSGQLRQLLMKQWNHMLFRTENRMHWAPNFQREGQEYYQTIAGWDHPQIHLAQSGPYVVQTIRQDLAPHHPHIQLTAVYNFYDRKPYFTFYSEMEFTENAMMKLLRNDEMTMDSMFTNVAYQAVDDEIVDLEFSNRYDQLEKRPIENEAPWLCFYHAEKKYAFASIRLQYDITSRLGEPSPTFFPHTRISDGANGGKYWNRWLISERLTTVSAGSRYREENAYLIFSIREEEPFQEILYWVNRLRHPIQIKIINEK